MLTSNVIATAVATEIDRFGENPDYSRICETEEVVENVFSSRERPQIFPMSDESKALARVQKLYALLCKGYITQQYYRKEVEPLVPLLKQRFAK